jgi:hypothetical protein
MLSHPSVGRDPESPAWEVFLSTDASKLQRRWRLPQAPMGDAFNTLGVEDIETPSTLGLFTFTSDA